MNVSTSLRWIAGAALVMWATSLAAGAQEKGNAARSIGPDKSLSDVVLVRSTSGSAVVRFGAGPLEVVRVGDRLGRNGAEIVEIEGKRLILDERFTGRDGAPNRARVVLGDGERGGTRYHERLDETQPPARRPVDTRK
jgi:hypothetical protein